MTIRKGTQKLMFLVIFIVVIIASLSSCRTGRDLSARRLKPISAEKLLAQAGKNAFTFDDLTIRRINVQYFDGQTRTSFRASLKAAKDEMMLASISKLNIPVGRILLTPDSITYVNYIDRNYLEGDYSYISNLLDFQLNFNTVQAILSNPVRAHLPEMSAGGKKFDVAVEQGKYVLQSGDRTNSSVPEQSRYFIRNNRNRNILNSEQLAVTKLMFNPQSFVVEKMIMEDPATDRRLEVDFSDFEKIEGYDYPGAIDVKMYSGNELTQLNIRLKGLSTEEIDDVELNIPGSYQRIR